MRVLGIETSCDETSIAIIEDGKILANTIYSQLEHSQYGGVVPEIASRAHLEKIDRLACTVFQESGLNPQQMDLIAVTDSPGLAGALLVGISFALGLHARYRIPITGINHLEGHIFSVLLENPGLQFPFLALVVSGGHTAIYRVDEIGAYQCLGQTVDDAAGEAFDKVGKMLGFCYPAGKSIEKEASMFTGKNNLINFPIARIWANPLDFSFSGLKTAVKNFLNSQDSDFIRDNRPAICESFQKAVIQSLRSRLIAASKKSNIRRIALVGGVACNSRLREELKKSFSDEIYFPSTLLCTDNAAMIALAAQKRAEKGITRFPQMNPSASL